MKTISKHTPEQKKEERAVVSCSECGDKLSFMIDPRDRNYIADIAEGFGWSRIRGKMVCSKCRSSW